MSDLLPISQAKQLGAFVDREHLGHEAVYIARHGRRVAATVDADGCDRLLELAEDAADTGTAAAARRERAETAALAAPWDEARAELGRQ